jgi:hypothetical protein
VTFDGTMATVRCSCLDIDWSSKHAIEDPHACWDPKPCLSSFPSLTVSNLNRVTTLKAPSTRYLLTGMLGGAEIVLHGARGSAEYCALGILLRFGPVAGLKPSCMRSNSMLVGVDALPTLQYCVTTSIQWQSLCLSGLMRLLSLPHFVAKARKVDEYCLSQPPLR